MKINIDELQRTIAVLLLKLKQSKGETISVHNDYYWDIPLDEIYDVYKEPSNISIGSLVDDCEIIELSKSPNELLPNDFRKVASILKALTIESPLVW